LSEKSKAGDLRYDPFLFCASKNSARLEAGSGNAPKVSLESYSFQARFFLKEVPHV